MGWYGNGHGDGLIPSWYRLTRSKPSIDRAHQTNTQTKYFIFLAWFLTTATDVHSSVLIEHTAYLTLTFLALGCFIFPVACCVVVIVAVSYF